MSSDETVDMIPLNVDTQIQLAMKPYNISNNAADMSGAGR